MTATALPGSVQAFVREAPVQRGAIAAHVQAVAAETSAGARVLDAGAGEAPYRPLFTHCEYRTHDWEASPHPGAQSADVIADLAELPLPDDDIDLVVCTEVLEHVPEPGRALRELARVLRPGGRLLLTVPFVGELHEEPHDYYRYTPYGLEHLLTQAGFTDVDVQPLTGWYSTFAHILRHNALSTRDPSGAGKATYAVSFLILVFSELYRRVAPMLDRLDERRALPIGWAATARVPDAS
ncbi:MAG: methyltransferase domain-containing protein [Solirubrobacteraceae bacterium]|nr:methyltransferase domain-containing protein [Solirubrobacteraceae bacterium]